ncbi:MAG: hypothetical protein GY925_05680 [Actinomycetia bacterium]|nr:hypothetical protein [Actinomycetes bacterium]
MIDESEVQRIRPAAAAGGKPVELHLVSVCTRERGQHVVDGVVIGDPVPELFVWDESPWDCAVWGDEKDAELLEHALRIISNGSFPPHGRRDGLSEGHWHQLRDAMVFEAHVRSGNEFFATKDKKGFISNGKREALEQLGRTRIVEPGDLETELMKS